MATTVTGDANPWDSSAKTYVAMASKVTGYMAEKALAHHSNLWSEDTKTPGPEGQIHFVDVAAGPGFFTKILVTRLKDSGKTYSILCTDFAEAMLELAKADITDPNVKFSQMDGQEMTQIQDASMDGLNCLFGIMFMPQYQRCVGEMRRVLKKGAKATVGTWHKAAFLDMADAFAIFLGALEPGEISRGRQMLDVGRDPDELASYFKKAGFSNVEVLREVYELEMEDTAPVYAHLVGNKVSMMSLLSEKENAKAPTRELFHEFLSTSPLAEPFRRSRGYGLEMICNMAVATA